MNDFAIEKADLKKRFVEMTGTNEEIAEHFLKTHVWEFSEAVNAYYTHATNEVEDDDDDDEEEQLPSASQPTGQPKASSNAQKRPASSSKFKTFSDIRSSDEAENDSETNLFTGGEKSGLQVEDPNKKGKKESLESISRKAAQDMIDKAMREAMNPEEAEASRSPLPSEPKTKFRGTGYQLGSVDNSVQSKEYRDPLEQLKKKIPEKVNRQITFWKEGFQVGDGQLYRYDDPQNAEYLRQLNTGRAPLSLLDVEMFQDVDVSVIKKMDESFKPPKAKVGGFVGSGQRLGSPVPGEPIVSTSQKPQQEEKKEEEVKKDEEKKEQVSTGDASVQIRLADGSRLVHKFHSTDPVSKVFEFVRSSSNDNGRAWALAFAFPLQFIEEDSGKTIKEAGLVNAVIVQRWK